jgi:F-type H+-transporting ATPase subunit epsilon
MKLGVYSLQKVLFEGEATSLHCNTAMGEVTILDHHEPLISIVTNGALRVTDREKKDYYFNVASGFLEVSAGSNVKVMVETVE